MQMMMKVELSPLDIKRIREIAKLQGNDREELTRIDIWGIVNDALIMAVVKARSENKKK
jgi:hypothetical protein